MVEVADKVVEAAWKIKNLGDYNRRLERAARRVDELNRKHETAALVIYEAALIKSGRPVEEVRDLVARFQKTWEDEDDLLTIPRVSGIMSVEGNEWFFGDDSLKVMTGRLLGQFQHRVAQYNYIDEREVLRRWANSYDTRLFIRRRIHETEPVVGVIPGFDLPLIQYLRVMAGGDTVILSGELVKALGTLGFSEGDDYDTLSHAESLALHLDLPSPIVGEMLEDIAREDLTDFPEPPRDLTEEREPEEEVSEEESSKPSPEDRAARKTAREDPGKGDEPSRVQDPQPGDAPGVAEEGGERARPASPESGRDDAPGTTGKEGDE